MPEGDTIHTLAGVLGKALVGRRLEEVEVRGRPAPSLEHEVRSVEARGKNLLVSLASGEVVRVHLGMHGDWHRYPRTAGVWRKSPRRASLRFSAGEEVFVCFDAEELEFLEAHRLGRSRRLRGLGPDLISDPWEAERILLRARRLLPGGAPVVDLLLDQRVAAGIGNVYKSELLFLESVPPRRTVGELADARIEGLYRRARELLRSNLGGWPRTTTHDRSRRRERGARLWVYGRAGSACLRCGEAIAFARLGGGRRSTYWCPVCQSQARGEDAPAPSNEGD